MAAAGARVQLVPSAAPVSKTPRLHTRWLCPHVTLLAAFGKHPESSTEPPQLLAVGFRLTLRAGP